ncbi:MAG TPA: hypothetical protein VFY22_04025 [Hydrogenophaga sp.]|nr:hypothetical protein [Hydrogenophaga sp.]
MRILGAFVRAVCAAFGIAVILSGCAASYQVPEGKPTANLKLESDTLQKSGFYKGRIVLAMGELDQEGKQAVKELGNYRIAGDELDKVLAVEAGRLLQFNAVYIASGPGVAYFCASPFKAQLHGDKSYRLNMNFDVGVKECEIELFDLDEKPARSMGSTKESSSYSTFGFVTRSYPPVRPQSNPTFE